jgi:hypothetical protein
MKLGAAHLLVLVWTALGTWLILKKHTPHFLIKSSQVTSKSPVFWRSFLSPSLGLTLLFICRMIHSEEVLNYKL